MAISQQHKLEMQQLIQQLKNGDISSTDASRIASEFLFMGDISVPTNEKDTWRSYDAAIAKATIEMLEKISK